jgi:AAA+ superfamily predicted ATPase
MITFREVQLSPTVPEEEPMKDIELAINETLDKYRGKVDRSEAVNALRTQADLINRDEGWVTPPPPEGAAAPEPEQDNEVVEPEEETSYSRSDTKKKK